MSRIIEINGLGKIADKKLTERFEFDIRYDRSNSHRNMVGSI